MNSELIKTKQVRKDVFAYQYANGVIEICGKKYLCHSMTSAIKEFREDNPLRKRRVYYETIELPKFFNYCH